MIVPKIKTAVLYAHYGNRASYYDDWLDAFQSHPRLEVGSFNIANTAGIARLKNHIADMEFFVLLHSTNADNLNFIKDALPLLQNRRGKLISFVGNEYNHPATPMMDKLAVLKNLQPDYIATQLLQEAGDYLYAGTGCKIIEIPHALNPLAFQPQQMLRNRPIDIGCRSFRYPPYLGDDDRNRILDYFMQRDFGNLRVDVRTDARMNREEWAVFLNQCKAQISTEAGSFYLYPNDDLMNEIKAWVAGKQKGVIRIKEDSIVRRVAARLPWSVKQAILKILPRSPIQADWIVETDIPFEEFYERFFKNVQKAPVYAKAISSRHFDAIGTKTAQIMFPGRYNDILTADKHYLPLAQDFSNVDEVLRKLKDTDLMTKMVNDTYDYVMDQHTHRHRVDKILGLFGYN